MNGPLHYRVLTPAGPAAIAVVRVRGAGAGAFLARHVRLGAAREAAAGDVRRGDLLDAAGEPIDEILVSVHATEPALDLRLHLHGSPWLVGRLTELLEGFGAVNEQPRRRAAGGASACPEIESDATEDVLHSLWKTQSRVAAEAYELLPAMTTLAGAHWLLRQPSLWHEWLSRVAELRDSSGLQEELGQVLGRAAWAGWFLSPLRIVIAGPPNAGKSTLINALADRHVSLVSGTPGTTRDWVEAPGEVDGYPVIWIDTAGLRAAGDELEAAGIERTLRLAREGDAVILVLDRAESDSEERRRFLNAYSTLRPRLVVMNKLDLPAGDRFEPPPAWADASVVELSAERRIGLDRLERALVAALGRPEVDSLNRVAPFSTRQRLLLERSVASGTVTELLR